MGRDQCFWVFWVAGGRHIHCGVCIASVIGFDIVLFAALERLKFLSQRLDARQDIRHGVRQGSAVGGYAHRRIDVTQRILDDGSLLALAEHETDRRRIDSLVAYQIIDGGEVEIELADVLGPEDGILELTT